MVNTIFSLFTEKLISPLTRDEKIRSSFKLDREIIKVLSFMTERHCPDAA